MCAEKIYQYDTEPLLKQGRLSFEAGDIEQGESSLELYIRNKSLEFPDGITFGYEAAKVAGENLTSKAAIEVIERLRSRYLKADDEIMRWGIEAVLIDCYMKERLWAEGIEIIAQYRAVEKTNFLVNGAVFSFSRALASFGKTNEAIKVANDFFGDGKHVNDRVMPTGFWLEQNAQTAFIAQQYSNGLNMLDSIQQNFPEYYRSNLLGIVLRRVGVLEKLGHYSQVATQLQSAKNLLDDPNFPVSDLRLLTNKLDAYKESGWLDDDFNVKTRVLAETKLYQNGSGAANGVFVKVAIIFSMVGLPLFFALWVFRKRARAC